jgi:hypothetical protein
MKIPILSLAIVGGQAFAAHQAGGSVADKVGRFVAMYTGFESWSGNFHAPWLLQGYGPWLALGLAKKVIFPLARPRLGKFLPVSLS